MSHRVALLRNGFPLFAVAVVRFSHLILKWGFVCTVLSLCCVQLVAQTTVPTKPASPPTNALSPARPEAFSHSGPVAHPTSEPNLLGDPTVSTPPVEPIPWSPFVMPFQHHELDDPNRYLGPG